MLVEATKTIFLGRRAEKGPVDHNKVILDTNTSPDFALEDALGFYWLALVGHSSRN